MRFNDFFVPSVASWLAGIGIGSGDERTLQFLLPLGISFYTFQALSYVLDVHRGRQAPCRSGRDFLLFVSFFATVSAGPITRAGCLLPQLGVAPQRADVDEGLALVVRGFVRKIVFADVLATQLVSPAFAAPEAHSSSFLLLALYAYTFQIYMDVAAYTDIARGSGQMCGVRLPENFAHPYSAASVSAFWQRWHITMSSFFRDYLYFGLGGSRHGHVYLNLMLTFVAIGIWHGAGWNFVVYGFIHGSAVCIERGLRNRGMLQPGPEGSPGWWLGVCVTFHVVVLSRVLFRADDLDHARRYLQSLFSGSGAQAPWPIAGLVVLLVAAVLHWLAPGTGTKALVAFGRLRVLPKALWLVGLTYGLAALSTGELPFVYLRF